MLPVMPLPVPVLFITVSSVTAVESVGRGPLPSGMVEGSVAAVVGTVVGMVVGAVVGMVVGMVVGWVTAGFELRQPQAASIVRVRTSTVSKMVAFFI